MARRIDRRTEVCLFALFAFLGRPGLFQPCLSCRIQVRPEHIRRAIRHGEQGSVCGPVFEERGHRLRKVTTKGHKIVAPVFAVRGQDLHRGLVQVGQQEVSRRQAGQFTSPQAGFRSQPVEHGTFGAGERQRVKAVLRSWMALLP